MSKAPRHKKSRLELDAGVMAWANFWPAWEIDGEEHPIIT